jgi:hypothetical protein
MQDRKKFVVTCKRSRRDVPAGVKEFAFGIQLPMPGRALVRGIEDWVLKERVFHDWWPGL